MNIDQVAQYYAELWAAFPDMELRIDDMVVEEYKLAVRYTMQGTHTGAYIGIPATGKRIATSPTQFARLAGEKAIEMWELPDVMGVLIQLGIVPDPMAKVH